MLLLEKKSEEKTTLKEHPDKPHLLRVQQWNDLDSARTGFIPHSFDDDFGYDTLANLIFETPLILYPESDQTVYVAHKSARDLFDTSVIKEEELTDSKKKIETSSFLAHIRRATIGDDSYSNSHPFVATDNRGRTWTLIHNGTIFDAPELSVYRHYQKGSTDSERILLYLIDNINKLNDQNPNAGEKERFALVEKITKELSPENKLNLIIYDNEYLYVHKNAAGTLYVNEQPGVAMFSTLPLDTTDIWNEVLQNTLLVYKEGSVVYTGTPHNYSYIEDPEKIKLIFMEYSQL